ncbi:glycosyltransferase [Thalassovita mediterranea]|nr:glycosyltransferase [Thalassovita mediterranea]
MSLSVVHVVASVDDEAAGPSISVPRLAEAQKREGVSVELSTVATSAPPAINLAPSVEHRRHKPSFSSVPVFCRLVPSKAMRRDLTMRAASIDVAHTHGLWLLPNIYPSCMADSGTRIVLSPRGMLGAEALAFSRKKKRIFHALLQKRALEKVSLLHATSEAEAGDIRAFGLTAPIVIAPNGIDIPCDGTIIRKTEPRTILSLGRIHPKKGLDRLIHAFAGLKQDYPNWRLRIIGPSELGHGPVLQRLAGELGCSAVSIEPPVFGDEKLAAYQEASIFALPTRHENFAMTVAEALAAGTPVISTKGAPWAGLNTAGCGLWVDHGPEPMRAALSSLMALSDEERAQMGARGRAWMASDFSWGGVAQTIVRAYEWIKDGGETPESIRLYQPEAGGSLQSLATNREIMRSG